MRGRGETIILFLHLTAGETHYFFAVSLWRRFGSSTFCLSLVEVKNWEDEKTYQKKYVEKQDTAEPLNMRE